MTTISSLTNNNKKPHTERTQGQFIDLQSENLGLETRFFSAMCEKNMICLILMFVLECLPVCRATFLLSMCVLLFCCLINTEIEIN